MAPLTSEGRRRKSERRSSAAAPRDGRLYQAIEEDARQQGLKSVRVGGTWWWEPEVSFYRRKFNATWLKEYDVKDKSYFWESPGAMEPSAYDYFVFTRDWDPGLKGPQVRTVFQDEKTGTRIVANEK